MQAAVVGRGASASLRVLRHFRFKRDHTMQDLIWIAVSIAFFLLSIGYVRFCDRLK